MAQKTNKRISRISQSFDLSPPKAQLSSLEKDIQEIIDSEEKFLDYQKSKNFDIEVDKTLEDDVTTLRQHMRTVRRWRNGSSPFGARECDTLAEYLQKTYIKLLSNKVKMLEEELKEIDEFILILDDESNGLRQNIDDDLQSIEKVLESLKDQRSPTKSENDLDRFRLPLLKENDNSIKDLQESIHHLHLKIEENNNTLASNLAIQATSTPIKPTPPEGNLKSFELNPARNRVLATADQIRKILRALKAGGHMPMDSSSQNQIQNCADNDMEVLRRQLRKIHRWQQSLETFYDEDVDDLHLIVSAIERHTRDEEHSSENSTSASNSPSRLQPAVGLTGKLKSSGSSDCSDTESFRAPSSTDSEPPPPYQEQEEDEACSGQITIKTPPSTNNEPSEADGVLDENCEFSERLI